VGLNDAEPDLADLRQRWLRSQARLREAREIERSESMKAGRRMPIPHDVMMQLADLARDSLEATDAWRRLDAEYTAAREQSLEERHKLNAQPAPTPESVRTEVPDGPTNVPPPPRQLPPASMGALGQLTFETGCIDP
jgi:hypothetical protein